MKWHWLAVTLLSYGPSLFAQGMTDSSQRLDFKSYIQEVMKKNQMLESIKQEQEAQALKYEARDLDQTPSLFFQYKLIDDRKYQSFGAIALDQSEITDYSLGVSKKWSTGTQTQISLGATDQTLTYVGLGSPQSSSFSIANLGIQISQSLWKDGFGRSTELKNQRENKIYNMNRLVTALKEDQILIFAEQAYWDFIYYQQELKQRQESLVRAKSIESWIGGRVQNGLAEESDSYGAQALVALRELQVASAQDELQSLERTLRLILEWPTQQPLPEFKNQIVPKEHPLYQLWQKDINSADTKNIIKKEALISQWELQVKTLVEQEVKEQFKPDLLLEAQYKTNSVKPSLGESFETVTDLSRPTTAIGLKFQWLFGSHSKNSQIKMAEKEQISSSIKFKRQLLESQNNWSELVRRFKELTNKVTLAEKASRLQTLKVTSERKRLTQGRAITSQVLQTEQEASESALTWLKLQVEQVKLLSQLRLFTKEDLL